ncbi:hydroxyphenylacetyl-CoA thioesterase PaaI [Ekhidna sp. To15]|uniref:hydroxyphenylacetyl-CoA thioesterase PaaI n=1 Tax=Ekhidna sp. To15 TaxID=3395267 RepID=UPI003F51FA6B
MSKANKIVSEMMAKDTFSQWLGIEVLEVKEGFAKIKMTVRNEMLNGHLVAHGGISFSLADSAFAFASNSHGQKAVSIETSINHIKPIFEGDELIATAEKESTSKSLGQYIVRVTRGEELVGLFKGVVFRKQEEWKV